MWKEFPLNRLHFRSFSFFCIVLIDLSSPLWLNIRWYQGNPLQIDCICVAPQNSAIISIIVQIRALMFNGNGEFIGVDDPPPRAISIVNLLPKYLPIKWMDIFCSPLSSHSSLHVSNFRTESIIYHVWLKKSFWFSAEKEMGVVQKIKVFYKCFVSRCDFFFAFSISRARVKKHS